MFKDEKIIYKEMAQIIIKKKEDIDDKEMCDISRLQKDAEKLNLIPQKYKKQCYRLIKGLVYNVF